MKNKTIYLFVVGLLSILAIGTFAYSQYSEEHLLKFSLKSEETTYKLGEPINFLFELRNESNEKIIILDGFSIGESQLFVEVSSDGTNFIGCNDPGWGFLDVNNSRAELLPNQSVNTSGKVSWRMSSKNIPEFRFKKSGSFLFKAKYVFWIENSKNKITIESKPIQITIEQPQGEDLEVWNIIKDDGNFAYFIQTGEFLIPSYKTEEREKFRQKVEAIINTYPNSFYAQSLSESLTKFNTNEAKRQEFLQKLEKQN